MLEWKLIIGVLLIVEAVTIFLRFTFNKESKSFHISRMQKRHSKRAIHWHHFLIGLGIIPLAFLFSGVTEVGLFNIGIGVFLSDIIHHFVVLAVFMGNPEFYLVYKNKELCEKQTRKSLKKFVKEV